MPITYDNKRKDITFCTMLFKMPQQSDLNSLKHMNRKFEEFYLPSLKSMIQTFKRVALWCDKETAEYIKNEGLSQFNSLFQSHNLRISHHCFIIFNMISVKKVLLIFTLLSFLGIFSSFIIIGVLFLDLLFISIILLFFGLKILKDSTI